MARERVRVRLGFVLYARLIGYCQFHERSIASVFRGMILATRQEIDAGTLTVADILRYAGNIRDKRGSDEIVLWDFELKKHESNEFLRGVVARNYELLRVTEAQREKRARALDREISAWFGQKYIETEW